MKNKSWELFIFCVLLAAVVNLKPALTVKAAAEKTLDTAESQPKYALLVGVANYKNKEISQIDGCVNNVQILQETLVKKYAFVADNVLSLVNEQAKKEEIKKAFRTHLIENAAKSKKQGKEAVIVYYFCGHGSQYPDQDNEEVDGLDETFVAFDSRTDGVFDILDDEMDDLKAELRPATLNATFILESCHSGSGTRGGEYVAEEVTNDTRTRPPYKRKFPRTREEDALTYTELAAALSFKSALSETKDGCKCEKPYSLMTKALVEALNRATDTTTYRSLMREVATVVSEKSTQEPQVEGNRDAFLFGGAAKRTKPYIEIEKILAEDKILIRAGKVHGLRVGSQISVYSSESATNTGKSFWLTNGQVSQVGDFYSEVNLPKPKENPKVKDIKISSHIVLASPVFGGGSLLVELDTVDIPSTRETDKSLSNEIKKKINDEGMIESKLVKLVATGKVDVKEMKEAKGIIRMKKGIVSQIFPKPTDINLPPSSCSGNTLVESKPPAGDTVVYYLDEGDAGGAPLFGLYFLPDDKELAEKIFSAIRNYALQASLRSLDNAASSLPPNFKVSWEIIPGKLTETCVNGEKKQAFQAGKAFEIKDDKIPVGSFYRLKIKNISGEIKRKKDKFAGGEPYCITALFLKSDGEVKVLYPRINLNEALGDEKELDTKSVFRATYPLGVERLIIVVSKPPTNSCPDYSFYQSRGTRGPKEVLDRLITQSGIRSRDTSTFITDEPDQWGILNIDVNVVNEKPK